MGKNELLEQILSVMEPLVSYGFFWKPDEIKTIIETLLDIMDGKNDRPSIGMKYIESGIRLCIPDRIMYN